MLLLLLCAAAAGCKRQMGRGRGQEGQDKAFAPSASRQCHEKEEERLAVVMRPPLPWCSHR